jgi:histidine triad (HIT) family protein
MGKVPPFQHAPADYYCPFCKIANGLSSKNTTQDDVVFRDEHVTVFLASKNWPINRGHVLVIPNEHYENVFDLPSELGTPIHAAVKRIALAMKSGYGCDGISTRQHNERDGNQDVWHYHVHVYPRYKRDMHYLTRGRATTLEQRTPFAEKLRAALAALDVK